MKNYVKAREEFRTILLDKFCPNLPVISRTEVVNFLGDENADKLLALMKSKNFFWFFVTPNELPKNLDQDFYDLHEESNLGKVVNAIGKQILSDYWVSSNNVDEQRFFLAAFFYLDAFDKCNSVDFVRAKKHFEEVEQELILKADVFSSIEWEKIFSVMILLFDEFSSKFVNKMMELYFSY